MQYVFLHGLGQGLASWEKVLDCLPIPPQACRSPGLAGLLPAGTDHTYPRLYEAFQGYCAKFPEPLALCGLSLGGVLALHFAIEHPTRVRALTLIGTPYKMPLGLLRVQNGLFRLMPQGAFHQTGFVKAGFLSLCRSMQRLDFTGSLKGASCPALVLVGEKDRANRRAAETLAALLPDGRFAVVPQAGHEVNTDQPERLAKLLSGFWQGAL